MALEGWTDWDLLGPCQVASSSSSSSDPRARPTELEQFAGGPYGVRVGRLLVLATVRAVGTAGWLTDQEQEIQI